MKDREATKLLIIGALVFIWTVCLVYLIDQAEILVRSLLK